MELGSRIGNFEVEALLGQGGLAKVYKARHVLLGSRHALKVLSIDSPSLKRRLLREGSIQAQLRHPNVVAVTDVVDSHGVVALVMEFVEGNTLEWYLEKQGRLQISEALALFSQILAGVGVAHRAGVLHRDLKPANVLLTPMGKDGWMAKVTDFGLAKLRLEEFGKGQTLVGVLMGTPGYLAPEQARDSAAVDARADVFSLGVILYELLTGTSPYLRDDLEATLAATLGGHFEPLLALRPDCPPEVAVAVERCLKVEASERFESVFELAQALFGEDSELMRVAGGTEQARPLDLHMVQQASQLKTSSSNPTNRSVGPTILPSMVGESVTTEPPVNNGSSGRALLLGGAILLGSASIGLSVLGGGFWWLLEQQKSSAPSVLPATPPSPPSPSDTPVLTPAPMPSPVVTPSALPTSSPTPVPTPTPPTKDAVLAPIATPTPTEKPVETVTETPVVPPPTEVTPPPTEQTPPPTPENVVPAVSTAVSYPMLMGIWEGNWAGRVVHLRITRQDGQQLSASLEVLLGETTRTFRLTGTVDESGKVKLSEEKQPGLWLSAQLSGDNMSGMLAFSEQKKGTSFSVKRD